MAGAVLVSLGLAWRPKIQSLPVLGVVDAQLPGPFVDGHLRSVGTAFLLRDRRCRVLPAASLVPLRVERLPVGSEVGFDCSPADSGGSARRRMPCSVSADGGPSSRTVDRRPRCTTSVAAPPKGPSRRENSGCFLSHCTSHSTSRSYISAISASLWSLVSGLTSHQAEAGRAARRMADDEHVGALQALLFSHAWPLAIPVVSWQTWPASTGGYRFAALAGPARPQATRCLNPARRSLHRT